jgi:glycolate oxidase iron-sulfur subunit
METRLATWIKDTPSGETAESILRACVHCGFCLATCPTYQLLGDELDSPRGRIYQIKQVLEGAEPTRATQIHLDRCLTCRNCESTCPSGVEYGHLVDIGRAAVEERVQRPLGERLYHWTLREGLTRRWLFGTALRVGRSLSWALPKGLRDKVGVHRPGGAWPTQEHARKVLLLNGCTQPSMSPSIDAATARVLDAIGVQAVVAENSGCCGALRQHLNDPAGARDNIRRNIDAWMPYLESGTAEAIVINASGCGAMVKDYAHLMRDDPAYANKARKVVSHVRDLAEYLPPAVAAVKSRMTPPQVRRVAFHPPCSLQHGLKVRGEVEKLLTSLGAELVPVGEAHLCCGSAGTYSLTQPELASALRTRKLHNLLQPRPEMILSANIGCIAHLQAGTDVPVRHWIEWIDQTLMQPRHAR